MHAELLRPGFDDRGPTARNQAELQPRLARENEANAITRVEAFRLAPIARYKCPVGENTVDIEQ